MSGVTRIVSMVRAPAAGAFARSLLPQEKTLLAGTMDDGDFRAILAHY